MTETWADIYGAGAKHAEHRIGDVIRYRDPSSDTGENSGEILHIIEADEREPLRYLVSPLVGLFPAEIEVAEVIE